MRGVEGSGSNLSIKTSPLFKTQYKGFKDTPFVRSLGHSEISEIYSEGLFTPIVLFEADISEEKSSTPPISSSISDTSAAPKLSEVNRHLGDDNESSVRVTDEEFEDSNCQTEVTTGAEEATAAEVTECAV